MHLLYGYMCMYVCMFLYVYVCLYACMHACVCASKGNLLIFNFRSFCNINFSCEGFERKKYLNATHGHNLQTSNNKIIVR